MSKSAPKKTQKFAKGTFEEVCQNDVSESWQCVGVAGQRRELARDAERAQQLGRPHLHVPLQLQGARAPAVLSRRPHPPASAPWTRDTRSARSPGVQTGARRSARSERT